MKSAFYRLAGALPALVLALLLPLGAWATAYHAITIDGNVGEWDTTTERMATSSGASVYGYVTWDAESLYVAWPQVDFDYNNQACYVAVDTDPRSDPDTGNGATNLGYDAGHFDLDPTTWFRGSTVILPFNADILFMVKEYSASLDEHTYHYANGAWQEYGANGSTDYRDAFDQDYGNASGNNKDLEFRIDRAAIGKAASGDAVYVAAYCKNLDNNGGWGYLHRAMPGTAVSDGEGDKTFTHYRGYVLVPGIAPNAAAHLDCDPAPVVTSNADSGAGSLRQALATACPGATVTFSGDTSITLTSGELSINKRLTVDADSHAVTVSGNTTTRVFNIGASGVVTLSHLSIVSGTTTSSGGGISSVGALTVQDCVLSDNASVEHGGGIFNYDGGVLTVQNSVLSGNQSDMGGGGIGNRGMLTLRDSTLSGNSASYGGGIVNHINGQMTVDNSTLSGNSATDTSDYGGGGAIDQYSTSTSAMIINSTLVSNTAVYLTKSGIWLEAGTLTLRNSIVANNNGTNNFQQESYGVFTSLGYNLSNAWNGMSTQSTDLTGDPLLGPLADNGGDTQTHALLANSPAIDAGAPATCPAIDQRGLPRADLRCDIGAFERQFSDGDTVIKAGMTTGAQASFGPTFISMTVTGGDAGTITATKHLATPGGLYDTGELTATWWLTASHSPFTVTLALCYTEEDIAGLTEANLRAFRWYTGTGGVLTWTDPISTGLTVDEDTHCVILTGIEGFSAWTLKDVSVGEKEPSAARVVGVAARGLAPVAALLALGGVAAVITRRRRR